MGEATALSTLPPDLWLFLARSPVLNANDLLNLARVCHTFSRAVDVRRNDRIWQELLQRQLGPKVDAFFGGSLPPPLSGCSWRSHYFFMRRSWKQVAQQRTGRLLVQVGAQQLSGRRPHETASLRNLWRELRAPEPTHYGIYDVTAFSDVHPGIELLEAADVVDATWLWEMNAHSDRALRLLWRMAVPGLESLPYETTSPSCCRVRRRRFGDTPRQLRPAVMFGACALVAAMASMASVNCAAVVCAMRTCDEGHLSTLSQVPLLSVLCSAGYVIARAALLWPRVSKGLKKRSPGAAPMAGAAAAAPLRSGLA